MVAMVVLLLSLIGITLRLDIGAMKVSRVELWLSHIPFSVYLGWITVATIANASYVLYDAHWDGFGLSGALWAVIMLVIATILTLTVIISRHDIAYAAVIVWALLGIVVKQSATPLVAISAGVMTAVVIGAVVVISFRQRLIKAQ